MTSLKGGFPLVQLTMLFAKPLKRLWRILPRTGDWATDIIAGLTIIGLVVILIDLILRMSGVI